MTLLSFSIATIALEAEQKKVEELLIQARDCNAKAVPFWEQHLKDIATSIQEVKEARLATIKKTSV